MPKPTDKRKFPRFRMPGATLSYKGDIFTVVNLAKGGLSFSATNRFDPGRKLSVLLTFSEKDAPIQLKGQVVYCIPNPEMGKQYNIGIRFAPFSTGKGHNLLESYRILEQIENKQLTHTSR